MDTAVEVVALRAREWRDVRRQSWLRGWTADSFFPPRGCEPAILEEGVGDHRHERVTLKALPGAALEVIKAKLFFQLWGAYSQIHRALIVAAKASVARRLAPRSRDR